MRDEEKLPAWFYVTPDFKVRCPYTLMKGSDGSIIILPTGNPIENKFLLDKIADAIGLEHGLLSNK
jgi:hypothetical protein